MNRHRLTTATAALAATAAAAIGIQQAAASPASKPPRPPSGEIIVTPQIIQPGEGPRATNGATDEPNPCRFPIRTWAYVLHSATRFADGDIRIHVIKAISYQPLDQARTIFETDNFNVVIHHAHPQRDWTITGRYGEWHLGGKLIWLEQGRFSATPTPDGGETLNNPHPRRLARQPNLCTTLQP